MLNISTRPGCFYINTSTEPLLREQDSQVLCHGECKVCYYSIKGEARMCLDENDFPLPATGWQASGGHSEKETHEGEDDAKEEQQ